MRCVKGEAMSPESRIKSVSEVKQRHRVLYRGQAYRVLQSGPSGRRNGWELHLSWRNGRLRIVLPDTTQVEVAVRRRR